MNVVSSGTPVSMPAVGIFGPVPSRRLGQSLGIGNVLPKTCSYACVYCQVGPTPTAEIEPRTIWATGTVADAVARHVETLRARGERIDYLTFVPDGEPTLDGDLASEIDALRPLGIPIAVITNGSLVWREDVRAALGKADWVSLKVDAADERIWRRINRPHASLALETVFEGMLRFAGEFRGELATETMLVEGVNDDEACVEAVAAFVERVRPHIAYIAAPTRPATETWVRPANEAAMNHAYQRFSERLPHVELLTGFEGTGFGTTGDVVQDLLAITSVHPMREDAVDALLEKNQAERAVVDRLVTQGLLRAVQYGGHLFYLRRFS